MTDLILFNPKDSKKIISSEILMLASVPISKGYRVSVIDQDNKNWRESLKNDIEKGAKIVYFHVIDQKQFMDIMKATKLAIKTNPHIYNILGGRLPKIKPNICMQDYNIEIVSYCDDYYLSIELLDFLAGNKNIDTVSGILYRGQEGAKIKKTISRRPITSLDTLPRIPWEIIDFNLYKNKDGCIDIEFTFSNENGSYSIENGIKELNELSKVCKIRHLYAYDFLIKNDQERFISILKALIDTNKDYTWSISKVNPEYILQADEVILSKLYNSGCTGIEIDVVSGSLNILNLIDSQYSLYSLLRANKRLSKYPTKIEYNFIAGLPSETENDFRQTLQIRKILKKDNSNASVPLLFYTPNPNDPKLFALAIKYGYKEPRSLKDWHENYKWYKQNSCWLKRKNFIKLIENAVLISKITENKPKNIISKIYAPIAYSRNKYDYYHLMIEKPIIQLSEITSKEKI